MASLLSLVPLTYVLCGLLPLCLVPYARLQRSKPGATGLLVVLFGLSLWSTSYGLLLVASSYATMLGLGTLVVFGGQLAAIGYFLLAVEFTDTVPLTRRLLVVVAVVTAFVPFLSITEPFHGLLWGYAARPVINTTTVGPLVEAVIVVMLGVAIAASALLVVDVVTAPGVRRKQSFALVLAGVPTIIITVVDVFVLETAYSVLSFGVLVSVFVLAWALFRMDFLDVVPVGRKRIVEEMRDAAVVLDGDDRVVECNPAARRLVGVSPNYGGMPVEQFFRSVPDAVEQFRSAYGVDTQIAVDVGEGTRHFHLQISRLDESRTSTDAGRLIVLRDVTTLKRRERALQERETELEFLHQVLVRVLRHNFRNDLTVVRGYAELLAAETDDEHAELIDPIIETSDELIDTTRKARIIERVIDRETATRSVDLAAVLRDLIEEYRDASSTASFTFDAPDRCVVETDPWLEIAFETLIENAVEHNDNPDPTVEVCLDRTDSCVTVTIDDDGPGIHPDELAVLEEGEETPMKHVSGIGLWIVHWVVDRSAASISFATDDGGTRVSVRIPA